MEVYKIILIQSRLVNFNLLTAVMSVSIASIIIGTFSIYYYVYTKNPEIQIYFSFYQEYFTS